MTIVIPDSLLYGPPVDINLVTVTTGGGGGGGDIAYVHEQTTPLATWTIPHSFNRPPLVSIIDTDGKVIFTDVEHSTGTSVVLTFSVPKTGKAILT
jgi:hypothetical protein